MSTYSAEQFVSPSCWHNRILINIKRKCKVRDMKAANSSNVYILNTSSQAKGTKSTSFHTHAQAKDSLVTKVLFIQMQAKGIKSTSFHTHAQAKDSLVTKVLFIQMEAKGIKSTTFHTHAYIWIELGATMN